MPSAGEEGPILRNAKLADLDLSMVLPWYAGANSLNFYMIDVDHDWRDVERFVCGSPTSTARSIKATT